MRFDALKSHELGHLGADCTIHPTVEIFGAEHLRIGDGVRIDCFAVISAGPGTVSIGGHTHIAAGVYIYGGGGVDIGARSKLSPLVTILSQTDDFTDGSLAGPLAPHALRHVISAPVVLERHALVGAGCVLLPGVTVGFGASVGAQSLVREDVPAHAVVAGVPARVIGTRDPERLRTLDAQL